MLASPVLVGVIAAGPALVQVPLVLTWCTGYLWFNAVGLWLKSRRQARYLPPVRAYTAALVPLGALVLVMQPGLARWAAAFAPLVGFGLWMTARRQDRALASGIATVIAAAGFTAVIMDAAGPVDIAAATRLSLIQFGYLVGTLLYVKTMIRERGNPRFLAASVGWHVACTAVALSFGLWPVGVIFATLTARAWFFSRMPLSPKQVGKREFGFHAAVIVAALLAS